jgi:hypothetical protein
VYRVDGHVWHVLVPTAHLARRCILGEAVAGREGHGVFEVTTVLSHHLSTLRLLRRSRSSCDEALLLRVLTVDTVLWRHQGNLVSEFVPRRSGSCALMSRASGAMWTEQADSERTGHEVNGSGGVFF